MVIAGLTPREAVRAVEARLSAAGCPDADYDARELFRVAAGRDARLSDRVLTTEEAEKLEALCTRREQREPLQYLCGIWSFLDFDLAVGPGVLCPRADTEVVAEAAANTLTGIAAPRVLDLCAGTGCLGLGIKRFCPAAQVTCVEKSPEAFVYLEKNCRCALKGQGGQTEDLLEPAAFEQEAAPAFDWGPALNALRAKAKPAYAVQPVEGDLFTYWQGLPEGQLDLIVSNPPYLTAEEMRHLQLGHSPHPFPPAFLRCFRPRAKRSCLRPSTSNSLTASVFPRAATPVRKLFPACSIWAKRTAVPPSASFPLKRLLRQALPSTLRVKRPAKSCVL